MNDIEFLSKTEDETIKLGIELGKKLIAGSIVTLDGTLGAGKTYLTKGIAVGLGIDETITSPTFTLISEYEGRLHLYHMDVYRLDSEEDFLDLGAEEMLFGDGVCIVEWAEKVSGVIPSSAIKINVLINEDGTRTVKIKNPPKDLRIQ